jgi:osmotically-inducible protein OsmY
MATATSSKTDRKLQQDVIEELTFDPQLQVNEIGVIATDGVVTLTGWVDSYLKKWRAEEAAHRVRGVRAVAMTLKSDSYRSEPTPILQPRRLVR